MATRPARLPDLKPMPINPKDSRYERGTTGGQVIHMENHDPQTKVTVRTPLRIKNWLIARARSNHRSMTAELVHILNNAMTADGSEA
jgi:hypothetical protein